MTNRVFDGNEDFIINFDSNNNLQLENTGDGKNFIFKLGTNNGSSVLEFHNSSNNSLLSVATSNFTTCNDITVNSILSNIAIPVAYGTVQWGSSDHTLSEYYPLTGISVTNESGDNKTITIPEMESTDYLVCTSMSGVNEPNTPTYVHTKTTTSFIISGPAKASNRAISFIVFGQVQ